MEVSLQKISSLYSEDDPPKLIKSGILSTIVFDTESIKSIEQVTNNKGKINPNVCIVYLHQRDTPILLNHSLEEICYLKLSRTEIKGFAKQLDKTNEKRKPRKRNSRSKI
jgi:hypothetical protein